MHKWLVVLNIHVPEKEVTEGLNTSIGVFETDISPINQAW
jgi:hypothetical protein